MTHDDGVEQAEHQSAKALILELSHAQNAALVGGDIQALQEILASDYTALHIDGYEQQKDEWMAQIRSGRMTYHLIEERSTELSLDQDTAVLKVVALVDATIYGTRAKWPLRTTTTYELRGGRWWATHSQAQME